MISYDQFRDTYNGKPVDVDHAFGNQCWDLVALYNELVIGIPASQGWGLPTGPDLDALDVWEYFEDPLSQYFDKVQAPFQKGDVIIWGIYIGKDGHIDIFDHAIDANNWVGFDQNWPIGSYAHLQTHNYNGILGGLRPKNNKGETMTVGTMAAMKFIATRQNSVTQPEIDKYQNDVEGYVQYLTAVQSEHSIAPMPYSAATLSAFKQVATRQDATPDEIDTYLTDYPGFAKYLRAVQDEHNIVPQPANTDAQASGKLAQIKQIVDN